MMETNAAALRRSTDVLTSDINGEIVLLNPETGDCYSLTGVGATVWQAMSDTTTLDDVVAGVCEHFDVEPERAREDAQRFVEQLIDEGLAVREPLA